MLEDMMLNWYTMRHCENCYILKCHQLVSYVVYVESLDLRSLLFSICVVIYCHTICGREVNHNWVIHYRFEWRIELSWNSTLFILSLIWYHEAKKSVHKHSIGSSDMIFIYVLGSLCPARDCYRLMNQKGVFVPWPNMHEPTGSHS